MGANRRDTVENKFRRGTIALLSEIESGVRSSFRENFPSSRRNTWRREREKDDDLQWKSRGMDGMADLWN